MIIERKAYGTDILTSGQKHIAFAINTEGINDAGFAGLVSKKFWPELSNCGKSEIGTVKTKHVNGITFYGLVCHSLKTGWGENQMEIICRCFNSIQISEPIASIRIGSGMIGILSGANLDAIISGMEKSEKEIILF